MATQKVYYKLQVFWHVKPESLPLSGKKDPTRKISRSKTQVLKEVLADPTKPLRPAHTPRQTLNQCEEVSGGWLYINTAHPAGLKRNDKATRKAEGMWIRGLFSEQRQELFSCFVGESGARIQLVEVEQSGVIASWVRINGVWTREAPEWRLAIVNAPRNRRRGHPKIKLSQVPL